jgi:glycosyltransferase involved in cell wall biosynthesis
MSERKIKIVHILEGFLGGTSSYVCAVLPELARKGFDVTLICSTNRCSPDAAARLSELREKGVTVHIIPMHREINPLRDTYSFMNIYRLLSKSDFDIVHTHCSKAGALGRVAGFLTGKNVRLHTPHCFAFTRCNGRFRKIVYLALEKLLGRLTTKLVAVAQSEASIAVNLRIVHDYRCVMITNGLTNGQLPLEKISLPKDYVGKASLGIDKDKRVVITACRLVEYKGIFRFLQAAELSRAPNTIFLIAGDGELRTSAEKLISERKLNNKVKLLGHVSNMEQIYNICDVVVLCSDAEAQPYLLLEAMRAKRPIVATSVIGNKELISHNNTGFLAEPNPVSIAGAIDELLADSDKRNRLAENAYAYFHKNHTLDKQISELTSVYKSLCKG